MGLQVLSTELVDGHAQASFRKQKLIHVKRTEKCLLLKNAENVLIFVSKAWKWIFFFKYTVQFLTFQSSNTENLWETTTTVLLQVHTNTA
jgi:hypothetical protein